MVKRHLKGTRTQWKVNEMVLNFIKVKAINTAVEHWESNLAFLPQFLHL
jgi:hypothetical protein